MRATITLDRDGTEYDVDCEVLFEDPSTGRPQEFEIHRVRDSNFRDVTCGFVLESEEEQALIEWLYALASKREGT